MATLQIEGIYPYILHVCYATVSKHCSSQQLPTFQRLGGRGGRCRIFRRRMLEVPWFVVADMGAWNEDRIGGLLTPMIV